ncbi:MAG: Tad domain-containing protein, partial [Chloroflexota bacterium]|nr:Tad domain-containing protein [Chloroflexota bacterium]
MIVPFRHRRIPRDPDFDQQTPAVKAGAGSRVSRPNARSQAPRGQVLVIFAGTFVVLLLMSALVIDLAWLWNNSLRIQRTADAAALAGVVHLPNDVTSARNAADKEATRNGFDGYPVPLNGVTVTPTQDAQNPRRLNVKVTAPVKTFFLGLIGMQTIVVSRNAHAEYVLPVPMGSPENYYGVFGDVRNATFTGTVNVPAAQTQAFDGDITNSWDSPANNTSGCSGGTPWLNPGNAATNNNSYADSNAAAGSCYWWRDYTFGFTPTVVSIDGIQVRLRAFLGGSGASTNCRLDAAVTWNAGTTWSATRQTAAMTTSEATYNLGGLADLWTPPAHTWTTAELNNATNFRVRLTWVRPTGTATCAAARFARVDQIEVNVVYTYSTTTTVTATYPLQG